MLFLKLSLAKKSTKLFTKRKETWKQHGKYCKLKLLNLRLISNLNYTDVL